MLETMKRYWRAGREAWAERHRLGEANKDRQTLAFLPAALEIQEKPPSPTGRILGWSLMALVAIAVAWTCVGRVNVVAVAEGKIIPGDRVKQIQPLEKGVIKTIYVSEGQMVEQGDPLVELDQSLTGADQERLRGELRFFQLALARQRGLEQLLRQRLENKGYLKNEVYLNDKEHSENNAVPPLTPNQLSVDWPLSLNLTNTEQTQQRLLLWQQWHDHRSRLGMLDSQLRNRQAERQASAAIIEKLETTLPIVARRAQALKTLYEKRLAPEHEFLELEQQRIEKRQDLKAERARQRQLAAAIEEVRYQIDSLNAELSGQTLNQIEESRRQIATLTQELNKARSLNARQVLYAPVDGKVQQLAVHTVGGVVTEAQSLMLIVPEEAFLEVEAVLENKDIGFVNQGQLAEIKVHTFPFTKYGVIDAEVVDITADAIENEERGLVYKMRLKMNRSKLWVNNKWVNLLPGMMVSAEVKTGKRRLIEFFMAPLLRYKDESIRER